MTVIFCNILVTQGCGLCAAKNIQKCNLYQVSENPKVWQVNSIQENSSGMSLYKSGLCIPKSRPQIDQSQLSFESIQKEIEKFRFTPLSILLVHFDPTNHILIIFLHHMSTQNIFGHLVT